MAERKLTGKISRERIRLTETPRPPDGIVAGFLALGDASGIVSVRSSKNGSRRSPSFCPPGRGTAMMGGG